MIPFYLLFIRLICDLFYFIFSLYENTAEEEKGTRENVKNERASVWINLRWNVELHWIQWNWIELNSRYPNSKDLFRDVMGAFCVLRMLQWMAQSKICFACSMKKFKPKYAHTHAHRRTYWYTFYTRTYTKHRTHVVQILAQMMNVYRTDSRILLIKSLSIYVKRNANTHTNTHAHSHPSYTATKWMNKFETRVQICISVFCATWRCARETFALFTFDAISTRV